MKLILTILSSVLAAADVYLTMHIMNRLNLLESEQNRLVKWVYKINEKWAWVVHAFLYAALISLPWVFPGEGEALGYGLLTLALGHAAQHNWKVYKGGVR